LEIDATRSLWYAVAATHVAYMSNAHNTATVIAFTELADLALSFGQ
jgi:hypothetical protein